MNFCKSYFLKLLFLVSSFNFITPIQNCFAWGKTGHHIVAQIAKHFLDKSTQDNVQMYLGSTSFDEASVWMDDMRSNPTYDFMKPWHYINIEKGQTYVPSNGENIVDRLNLTINELKHKQTLCDSQIKTDLLLLFHLMGDLHQPLHVGYGSDRGGNYIKVNFLSQPSNLHSVWDDGIIQHEHITLEDCLKLFVGFNRDNESAWRTIDVVGWMNDSRSYLNEVNNFSGQNLDEYYAQHNKLLIEKQLLFAGLRLASLLQSLFMTQFDAPGNKEPATNSPKKSITPADAINHIGESVVVCGKVYGTKLIDRSETTFINMGGAFPNSPFTVVIFKKDRINFKTPPASLYDNKNICVSGLVKLYNGKAEIIVSNSDEIKIQ